MFKRKMFKRKPLRALMFALALALCLGSFTAVFAEDGTEDDPAKATITKILKMPNGASFPAGGFTFTFDIGAVSVDGVAGTATNMPVIAGQIVGFTASDSGTSASNITTYTKESADIFAGVDFPHPGVYVYEVTEQQTGAYTPTSGWIEDMAYSPATYTLTVVVKQGASHTFIETIAVTVTTADNSTQNEGDKVDPTPGQSGMVFTNTYTKKMDGDDPLTNSTLNIGMTAAGDYADMTLYFPVEVTLTKSVLETGASPTYRAYVVDTATNTVVNGDSGIGMTKAGTDTHGDYYDFTSDTATPLNLKHGQTLAFVGVPVGTAWTATDTLGSGAPYNNYLASGTANGTALTPPANRGASLSTGAQLVREAASGAAFTNTYDITTPTGIILNNLPFIGLIVLAMAALGAFIAVKSRRRNRESNV
ncbi:MAG: hypothetical protein LBL36_06815 [Clostridiales Family XIII bacterium]|jgi:hypothetical protein|nr:hypothetical protein [Clostridiales Family XIII bacterium]